MPFVSSSTICFAFCAKVCEALQVQIFYLGPGRTLGDDEVLHADGELEERHVLEAHLGEGVFERVVGLGVLLFGHLVDLLLRRGGQVGGAGAVLGIRFARGLFS